MKPWLKTTVNILIWSALAVYTVFAVRYCSQRKQEMTCTGLAVEVTDSAKLGFITPSIVRNILVNGNIKITGEALSDINTVEIERLLKTKNYIKTAKVYTALDRKVHIEVTQRHPIMRIQTENGYAFYVSDDHRVLPIQRYFSVDVPIVTGVAQFPFGRDFAGELPYNAKNNENYKKNIDKNYIFLHNLINFVKFLSNDRFWDSQVVQINVRADGDVELIPRVGDALILLGDLERYDEKLEKLMKFYRNGLSNEGWNTYRCLNIKYANQVICTK